MKDSQIAKFKMLYEACYQLYPDASQLPKNKLYYLHRQWIFPNHIDPMLQYVESFRTRFFPDANLEIALIGALLHDTGLVYDRTNDSPLGHEEKSCVYAKRILNEFEYTQEIIDAVITAIESTEPSVAPSSQEATLVRNADAYSHLSTMHFIGKAHFAENITDYIEWFDKKVHVSIDKLTIPELIDEKQPLVSIYEDLLKKYAVNQSIKYIDTL